MNFYKAHSFLIKALSLALLCFVAPAPALAEEITAVDFNGDLLGKVIPDGKVVSFDNQLVGNVTADSLIIGSKGELLGGVIPQGVVVGTDNAFIGKVSNDGSVRLASGKVAGRVLPNGLVVDDYFNVIGSVLFPGLVYSDEGKTVGRLTGDGSYTNLAGQKIGFISMDGYAYRKIGSEYVLDGRLISSKMVVSLQGDFIGSVSPGGNVTDFNAERIGFIKANGYAYNEAGSIIGKIVSSGYAFDYQGKYLGFVTYNGEVVDKNKIIGRIRPDGRISDLNGNFIGYSVDISAAATDIDGKYLGRIMPNGEIAKARDIVGRLGVNGNIVDASGKIIGQIINSGPVFDYRGKLFAHALKSGGVVLLDGPISGYMKRNVAYSKGRIIGSSMSDNQLVVNNADNILGIIGINASFEDISASPLDYAFSADGSLSGALLPLGAVRNSAGAEVAYLSPNGALLNKEGVALPGKITQSGAVLDERNRLLGTLDIAHFPSLAINVLGNFVGTEDSDASIIDANQSLVGKIADKNQVLSNNNELIGRLAEKKVFLNGGCEFLGVLSPDGSIRNYKNVSQGRPLQNNQAVSDLGTIVGYGVSYANVVDYNGNVLGAANAVGKIINYSGEDLGCLNKREQLVNSSGVVIGAAVRQSPVINFNGEIIGKILSDGSVVDEDNESIGYLQPGLGVNSKTGMPLGAALQYGVAFDNNNAYLGRVTEEGRVLNDKGEDVGSLRFDGYIVSDNQKIGYALYDFYIYNQGGDAIAYIAKDGSILSFDGKNMGRLDRGFLVDKSFALLGRGNRDYYIRDDAGIIVGELGLNGVLLNLDNQPLGEVDKEGIISDANGNVVAAAKPLQYYNLTLDRQKVYDEKGDVIGYVGANNSVVNEDGEIIGLLQADGTVVSANGDIIGGIGVDWYEKVEAPKARDKKLPEVGVVDKDIKEKAGKSFGIALTPDGEYLGDIFEDGRVFDKSGQYLGKKMPDGLIMNDDGALIGIEESQKSGGGDMFIPAGTFGRGGAYGTGTGPGGNLGPGGGFGPGERYDSQRAEALAAAQEERRKNISVGKLSSNVRKESFDGMQKDWAEQGITKVISSWRVDMSEMIFADKPIPAVIARSIDSNNPTPITAFVERNVYAEEGRNILIPAGSRLIGTLGGLTASTEATSHSAKVQISWERLIRPDGSLFVFQGITGDAQGRGGALGYLDQQLFKKYTLPIMTTALTSYTSYMMAPKDDSGTEIESPKQQAANDARQNFLNEMNQVFEQILQDKTNIKPLTYVPAGTRIIVYPNVDLWLRNFERDKEAGDADMRKRNILIDDKEVASETDALRNKRKRENSGGGGSGGVDSGSSVVYESEDPNINPVRTNQLIDDNQMNQQRAQQRAQQRSGAGGTPPPPPPSFSVAPSSSGTVPSGPAPSAGTSGGSSGSSGSVPQLF